MPKNNENKNKEMKNKMICMSPSVCSAAIFLKSFSDSTKFHFRFYGF